MKRSEIISIKINLGYEVKDFESGILVENIPFKQFKHNLLISGLGASEKSAVLSYIFNQIYEKVPEIGVLLIKLRANKNSYLYHLNKVYEYGKPELEIPYFLEHGSSDVNRGQLVCCLNALFGFHYEMRWVMGSVIRHYKVGHFPSSLVDYLEDVKNYLIVNPYAKKFNESNIKNVEKAIELVQNDPILNRILWLSLFLPEWLKFWGEGKKVLIDLSSCEPFYQKMLVTLLFQNIVQLIPTKESDMPSGIVVLEDADHIFEECPLESWRNNYNENKNYYNLQRDKNYFLTKEQLEQAYGDPNYLFKVQLKSIFRMLIIDEFRYRNISLITTCEDATKIYEYINSISELKINLE